MLILKDFDRIGDRFKDIVITIGNFDGLHLGHQKVLKAVKEHASVRGGTPAVLTFDPHPVKVLEPSKDLRIITPFEEKARLIEALGIELLLCLTFNRELAGMRPVDFIRDIIIDRIGAVEVIVGHGYRFGKRREGTTELLRRMGDRYGFRTVVVRNKTLSGRAVSSSLIRKLIINGMVSEASRLLGRPYMIQGKVIKGKGRGESLLQIPTANIETTYELIPSEGVYAVRVALGERLYGGVMNIGRNPTFGDVGLSLEVHILDFYGDLLGSPITVYFIKRLRGEKRFPDIDRLRESIKQDINSARKILGRRFLID
ncbi:MAG: bifunctional riboflavin kinase/FAD synthetase [Thermodesulfovibrionales bacterium]